MTDYMNQIMIDSMARGEISQELLMVTVKYLKK